ncbi:MAG TPA: glutathione S-transferase family protein [Thermohalobaculum sp.]|nr:glutathione S-transferase family protein [Thermohalobaculum sp.]
MSLRLHWSPDSANLVVRIALEELGLAFEGLRVDRAKAGHKRPEYLALNPQGLIPVLQDGDLVLFETGAILLHLADRTGRLGPDGPPADHPAARAAFLKWLFYISNTVHADLRAAFYSPRYIAEAGVPALRDGLAARLTGHLAMLEGVLAPTGWLVAETPSLADFYLAACLRWAQIYPTGRPLLNGVDAYPHVGALLQAVEARPAVRRACAAEAIGGKPFTLPELPVLPVDQVTG